jgi:hypothetical protein
MTSRWDKVHHNLGEVKEGTVVEVVYTSTTPLDDIANLSSSCSCSTPKRIGNSIKMSHTTGSIPVHLKSRGFYMSTQYATVTYKNGEKEYLSLEVKVIKK